MRMNILEVLKNLYITVTIQELSDLAISISTQDMVSSIRHATHGISGNLSIPGIYKSLSNYNTSLIS